jgi:hypothetical protein
LVCHVAGYTIAQRWVRMVHMDGQPGNHCMAGDTRKIIMSLWTLPLVASQARILVANRMSYIARKPAGELVAG